MNAATQERLGKEVAPNPAGYEVGVQSKTVSFEDMRGILRQPHELATECYASPEIQTAVGEHFLAVDQRLEQIEAELAALESGAGPTEAEFSPLSDALLQTVISTAKEQLPALTRTEMVYETYTETTGRIFKKTEERVRTVEKVVPVEGYIADVQSRSYEELWRQVKYTVEAGVEHRSLESFGEFEAEISSKLETLLCSDIPLRSEFGDQKLPLLATKLRDAGLSSAEIDALTWDDIVEVVPEAEAWIEDVRTLQSAFEHKARVKQSNDISSGIREISPTGSGRRLPSIYYDEPTLDRLASLEARAAAIRMDAWEHMGVSLDLSLDTPEARQSDYLQQQHTYIAEFFLDAPRADTLLVHGTSFIPRIIEYGALRPAATMEDDEFTFNTNRTNIQGANAAAGIKGSMAVHWAGIRSNVYYARNAKYTEEQFRANIARKINVPRSHPWIDQELAKGGIGYAMLVMRYGDIVQFSPYGGARESSYGSTTERAAGNRACEVELTERGWETWTANEGRSPRSLELSRDSAFTAAPLDRPNEELFDYEYPIEAMLIGIPQADPEKIPALLREAGWTEEQIAAQTFIYDGSVDLGEELQRQVEASSERPHTLVCRI